MDSSGQGSSGSGSSSPWYGNTLAGPPGSQGRKREREDSADLQYLGIRGEPEAKSQKTTPSPVPSTREIYMMESHRGQFSREPLQAERLEALLQPGLAISVLLSNLFITFTTKLFYYLTGSSMVANVC